VHLFLSSLMSLLLQAPSSEESIACARLRSEVESHPRLSEFLKLVDENKSGGPRRKKSRTNILVVFRDSCPVFELYQNGFHAESLHLTWSISKSITSLLVGRAEQLGLLHRTDLVSEYIENWPHSQMSIEHVLEWSTGLEWQETYEFSPLHSHVVAMLYSAGRFDWVEFLRRLRTRARPGAQQTYSTGDSVLLGGILQSAVKKAGWKSPYDFMEVELFNRLGVGPYTFELDAAGNIGSGSYFYTTGRGLGRLGELVLHDGVWEGQQLLPADWIVYSSSLPESYQRDRLREWFREVKPARHWWRFETTEGSADESSVVLLARGHWGQRLMISKEQSLVVVRLADELDGSTSLAKFVPLAIEVFGGEAAP